MKKKKTPAHSFYLIISLTVLCLLGLFFVFEASTAESFTIYGNQYHFVLKQAQWLLVGIVAFWLGSLIAIKSWKKIAGIIYFLGCIALLLVFVPGIGMELNGAHRWIDLGFSTFQPVEFFKFCLMMFFAWWMSQHQKLIPFIFLTGLPSIILLLQPDMGSLLVILMIAVGLFYVAGGEVKKLIPIAGLGILILATAILLSPYRLKRIQTFFNPESDPLGASFQVRQITLALGSGGLIGRGLGNSQQKYAYIPEASSDSIFAIVAEEVGFIGSLAILVMFAIYFYVLYQAMKQQPTGSFAQLIIAGVFLWIGSQTLLNLAAIVALVPLTGLPLPFFSAGGSSLVMMLFGNGVVYKLIKNKNK